MYLVSAEEMRTVDEKAIKDVGIPGILLMENAGLRVVELVESMLKNVQGKKISIFAGKGNNGGDGFVIARHLINMGAEVKVLLVGKEEQISGDAKVNLNILKNIGAKIFILENDNAINVVRVALVYTDLIIDAIYGTGFKGAVSPKLGSIIEIINACGKPIIAVDIPSGLEADTGRANGPCIMATQTVTFGLPKLGTILYPGSKFVGELQIANISIPEQVPHSLNIKRFLTTGNLVNKMIPIRDVNGHKGTYGKVLVLGGAPGLTGAPAMTGVAALRIGAGLVTIGLPESLNNIMEIKVTEVMTKPLPQTNEGTLSEEGLSIILEKVKEMDVITIGTGLSTNIETNKLVQNLIQEVDKPIVLDADGINAMVGKTDLFKNKKDKIVITPHPGEMARLLDININEVEKNRLEIAEKTAAQWGITVVLKGYRTIIACPDGKTFINPTGNPGMATGGSGDVLTGIIAGLIGQGLSCENAAIAGVYIHGMAGDLLTKERGMLSLIATDLLEILPVVTKNL